MKKKLLFSMALFLCLFHGFSQNPYLNSVNLQLRSVFRNITYPNTNIKFLYDRSVKLSDSLFYGNNSPDTLDPMAWKQLYDEMYYAAHDTLPFTPDSIVTAYGNSFYPDTIPFAIMDYSYYYCTYAALNTGSYFIFDTINDVLYDNPSRPGTPFSLANIFACAPTVQGSTFSNPVFRIDPQLVFTDVTNSVYYQNNVYLQIDFGDGTGFHNFNPTIVNHYTANYTASGEVLIRTILYDARKKVAIKKSKSRFKILKSTPAKSADQIVKLDGMDVGVYNSCGANPEKVIIYLEGIDLLDIVPSLSRGIDQIYDEMIHTNEYIEELRDFNYAYYVVNWKNSTIDMRFNALYVVNLLEYLKQKYTDLSNQQFVIIGESMGGVIGRYALTFMESKDYQAGVFSSFFVEASGFDDAAYIHMHPEILTTGTANRNSDLVKNMHNVRELITLDSPHQGANIPLSIQHLYRKAMGLFFPGYKFWTNTFSIGLEAKAAKQLLLYHLNGKMVPGSSTSGYTSDPSKDMFYGQLAKMGNYPKYCKLVALSNGALSGNNQVNFYNGNPRVAGDRLFAFSTNLYARILWLRLPILSGALNLYTNPNGTGTFYSAALGNFTIKIKLKFWKIKINNTYSNFYNDNQIAVNVKPYCVSAGGKFYSGIELPSTVAKTKGYSLSNKWLLNVFDYSFNNDGAGCVSFKTHIGWQGFSSLNFDYRLCSDGFEFGFIPLQSALDYGNGLNLPLNHDIRGEAIGTKLPRTPFDLMIGYPDANNVNHEENNYHLNYRDEPVYNITHHPAINCSAPATYFSADAASNCNNVIRSLLCAEIGDEDMYLENMDLNRKADYQAEFDIRVNDRNPYYEYVTQPYVSGGLVKTGVYSKQKAFQTIGSSGMANFYFDSTNPATGVGFVMNAPLVTNYTQNDVPMLVCMADYATGHKSAQPAASNALSTFKTFEIYPNPQSGSGSGVTIEGSLRSNQPAVTVSVMDITGRQLISEEIRTGDDHHNFNKTLDLGAYRLLKGVYFVKVQGGKESFVKRLVIQ